MRTRAQVTSVEVAMRRLAMILVLAWSAGCGDDDGPSGVDGGPTDGGEDAAPPVDGGPTSCSEADGRECAADAWCDYPEDATCGAGGHAGVCRPRPSACPEYYLPTCGCDGATYSNECVAHAMGVDVAHPGECMGGGGTCGGIAGLVCADGEWCDYPPGSMCGYADMTGTCRPRPEVCLDIYDPVCGCDGRTYGNACEAAAGGTDVASEGPCSGGPCDAQDAQGVGPCDLFLGWFWNGTACTGQSGCSCVGTDCGSGFASREDCETAHAGCGRALCELTGGAADPACEPAAVELSAEICRCGSRWYWSGTACVSTAACRCNAGCDLLYETEAACRTAYRSCAAGAGT